MMMRMRPRSTTHDQPLVNFSLDPTHSHTQALSTLYGHNQVQSTHHEDLPQDLVHSANIRTRNTHPTTSYHLTTKPIMTRHSAPASLLSFLPRPRSEAYLSPVSLVLRQPQHPVESIQRLSVWSPSQ